MRRFLIPAALALFSAFAQLTAAQTIISPPSSPAIGIGYENVTYPYPVGFLQLEISGQLVRMAYMDVAPVGPPKGTVLLFHGKNFASDYWAPAIKGLSAAGWRVIAPDQIGFGKSSKPDMRYTFGLLASSTVSLLDSIGVREVNVIANSMGGMVAVHFTRLNPDRVTRLVLENPIGLEDYASTIPPQTTDTLVKLEMAQTEESYRRFLKSYFPVWKDDYETFVRVFAGVQASSEYPRFAKASALTYQMIYEQPIIGELPKIKVPTLLIIGQKDRTVFGRRFAPPEVVKNLGNFPMLGKAAAKAIPNARLIEIDEAGHVPHLEVPDQFLTAVKAFLESGKP